MGFIEKVKKWTSGDDVNDNGYDGYDTDDYDEDPQDYEDETPVQQQTAAPARNVTLNSGALEMKLIKPERYDSATAQKIADHLLSHRTVVLNLESTNKESARRLIDFLSGVAYSIDGNIQRVTTNTVVIVPSNVDVSGEPIGDRAAGEDSSIDADDPF